MLKTNNMEWYDPAAVTTANGSLQITLSAKQTHGLNYQGGKHLPLFIFDRLTQYNLGLVTTWQVSSPTFSRFSLISPGTGINFALPVRFF
jgi:hypothetical protein